MHQPRNYRVKVTTHIRRHEQDVNNVQQHANTHNTNNATYSPVYVSYRGNDYSYCWSSKLDSFILVVKYFSSVLAHL